jgi:hypothetical protein
VKHLQISSASAAINSRNLGEPTQRRGNGLTND